VLAVALLGVPVHSAIASTASPRAPVLGAKNFVPSGSGWGQAHPRMIHNGGAPSGMVRHIRWSHWGANRAIGRGKIPLYRPGGGYYRKMGRIVLRAQRLGHCRGQGRRAYTRLYVRSARRPGGPVSKRWHPWSSGGDICRWG
jgi:hypothetical protein